VAQHERPVRAKAGHPLELLVRDEPPSPRVNEEVDAVLARDGEAPVAKERRSSCSQAPNDSAVAAEEDDAPAVARPAAARLLRGDGNALAVGRPSDSQHTLSGAPAPEWASLLVAGEDDVDASFPAQPEPGA
jgi:hypothetical protein